MAKYHDAIVLCDPSPRIRKLGETADLVKQGLLAGGLKEEDIIIELAEAKATQIALHMAKPGDLVVLQVENIAKVTEDVLAFKQAYLESVEA